MLRFRSALDAAFGARIERVVLFCSRARGDHRPDSDHDVAVSLKGYDGFGKELTPIVDIGTEILFDTGAVIDAMPLREGSHADRTIIMSELRQDGVDL